MPKIGLDDIRDRISRYPTWARYAALTLTLVTLINLGGWGPAFAAVLGALALILNPDAHYGNEQSKVKNMMALLDKQGSNLRVGLEQLPDEKLKRVAIGEFSKEEAILQFPFNHQISTSHIFPAV